MRSDSFKSSAGLISDCFLWARGHNAIEDQEHALV